MVQGCGAFHMMNPEDLWGPYRVRSTRRVLVTTRHITKTPQESFESHPVCGGLGQPEPLVMTRRVYAPGT